MGIHYGHITIEERCEIACLQAQGRSIRQVASALDRSPSTIARELKRNGSRKGYKPVYANDQAWARRWRGSRLDRDDALRERTLSLLELGWSPEQVAGRFKLEAGRSVISHETIYRFIYAQMARTKEYEWRHFLPQKKWKRGRYRRGSRSSGEFIRLRRPKSERPKEADDRATPGHWEADLMAFGNRGQSLLALLERSSRLVLALPLATKKAKPTAQSLSQMLQVVPPEWRRTVTFDNGTEFAHHYKLHALGIETFFCDTHSPWQKGGVENAIGRLRRYLPRGTNFKELSQARIISIIQAINNVPRKCLGYRTPAEVYNNEVLHLQCESIFLLAQE